VQTPLIAPASGLLAGLLGRRSPGAMEVWDSGSNVTNLPEQALSALEARAIWAKFGF
jgi:hypothetical protein